MKVLKQFLDIPSTDAEDARRRKLLNIMLLGLLAVDAFVFVVTLVTLAIFGMDEGLFLLLAGSVVALFSFAGLLALNRYRSGPWSSTLFLLLLTLLFTFSDVPEEVVDGRRGVGRLGNVAEPGAEATPVPGPTTMAFTPKRR